MLNRTLADACEIVMGQSPAGEMCNAAGIGLPLLNGPTEYGDHHPTPVQFTTDARKRAKAGDLLFCVRGSTTGRMNWADRDYAIGRGVAAIRHKSQHELQPLVRAVVEHHLPNLLIQATGSTFPNVSSGQLSNLPWPNLDECHQRAVARILGTLDEKIELNRRANETLEEMARALFNAWFVDFYPVRSKLESRWQRGESLPGLPAHLYDILPDRLIESEFGEVPDGWKYAPLRELASTISKGTTPTKDALNNASDTNVTYFLKVRDITEGGEIARNSLELIPISIHENALKRSILRTDDLLFSIAGTIGRVAIVDEDLNNSNCNQAIAFIRLKDKKNFQSLCWFTLRSKRTQDFVESKIVQGVQANASLATIGEIPVLVPNDGVLPAWNEFVRPLMQELKANQSQSRIVTRLRDALLPKLISGDLRVPDAERIVGATV